MLPCQGCIFLYLRIMLCVSGCCACICALERYIAAAYFIRQLRQIFLDICMAQLHHQITNKVRQLQRICHCEYGSCSGDRDEGICILQVRQSSIDRPEPSIFSMKVDTILAPVSVRERDNVHFAIARMEGVAYSKLLIDFLVKRCSRRCW